MPRRLLRSRESRFWQTALRVPRVLMYVAVVTIAAFAAAVAAVTVRWVD